MNSAFAAELERASAPDGRTRPSTWPAPGPTAAGSRSAITRTSPSPRCCCRAGFSAISTPSTPTAAGPTTSPTRPAAATRALDLLAGGATNCSPATTAGRPIRSSSPCNRPSSASASRRKPFLDLLSAFEQDQRVKRYRTFDQLLDYCRRSANPVGRLVLYLGEAFDETRAALSDHVCTALQLANFWQDVGRDFDIGRVYLPEEDRRRFGYGDDDLEARRFTPAFAELMRFEVEPHARAVRARPAAARNWSPPTCASTWSCSCAAAWRCCDKIERCGYDVWARRPVVSKWDQASLLAGAVVEAPGAAVGLW